MQATILPKLGHCKSATDAIDALKVMGAREIGFGHFSKIYRVELSAIPSPHSYYDIARMTHVEYMSLAQRDFAVKPEVRIIKVALKPDNGALIVARAAMACSAIDPLAPVYYGITEFGNGTFMAEMEELSPVHNMDTFKGITCRDKVPQHKYEMPRHPLNEAIAASPFLTVLKCYMNRGGYSWDIHVDNVMMRGNQPVVTDPMFMNHEC